MDKIEETVIVKISIAGMAEEGLGTRIFEIDPHSPESIMRGYESMSEAVLGALSDAMGDATPAVNNYFMQKYAPGKS